MGACGGIIYLPETKAILVFVDQLSKMAQFASCWNDVGAEELAQIFVREIFMPHKMPHTPLYPATLAQRAATSETTCRAKSHSAHEMPLNSL